MIENMTKSEEQVMSLLWKSDRPLSCTEIVELSEDKSWKDSYVHSLVKSLMKKGIVKIGAFELISRSYARKFEPKISYNEYVLLSGFSEGDFRDSKKMADFFLTFWDHSKSDELEKEINDIINQNA